LTAFKPLWEALDQTIATGWAPGLVAGVKYKGRDEFHTAGTLSLDSPAPMQLDTRFRIASLSKPLAGVLTLQMIADGIFDFDDPVGTWLPEIANPRVLIDPAGDLDQTTPAVRPITIRHYSHSPTGLASSLSRLPSIRQSMAVESEPAPFHPR
jgi:CubicO group peptidase (beta-lactamase class C family)